MIRIVRNGQFPSEEDVANISRRDVRPLLEILVRDENDIRLFSVADICFDAKEHEQDKVDDATPGL
jgi:hypothetical protein